MADRDSGKRADDRLPRRRGRASRQAIIEAAVASFGMRGYYGTTLQGIADRVHMTKAGVLHHVGSKDGLLHLVMNEIYDSETDRVLDRLIRSKDQPLLAEMWRQVVAINAGRPALVHMFSTLSAEALDPHHPAHAYFEDRERGSIATAMNIRWALPEGTSLRPLLQAGYSMMDGIQLRWLRTPGQDLNQLWAACEEVIFPLPTWSGYR